MAEELGELSQTFRRAFVRFRSLSPNPGNPPQPLNSMSDPPAHCIQHTRTVIPRGGAESTPEVKFDCVRLRVLARGCGSLRGARKKPLARLTSQPLVQPRIAKGIRNGIDMLATLRNIPLRAAPLPSSGSGWAAMESETAAATSVPEAG